MTSKRQKEAARRWQARVSQRLADAAGDEGRKAGVWLDEVRRLACDRSAGERDQILAGVCDQLRNLAKELGR